MGFWTSPWFAEWTLEYFEIHCLNTLKTCVLFYRRYVDDCFLIIKSDSITNSLDKLNSYNSNLQFTLEEEDEHQSIKILDMHITRIQNKLITNWYSK